MKKRFVAQLIDEEKKNVKYVPVRVSLFVEFCGERDI